MNDMTQRERWLKERISGIGASDASAVLGVSPYMTNIDLWEIKTGRRVQKDISDKDYVQYGIKAENALRDLFALDYPEYTVSFTPYKILRSSTCPFIFCTPDGELSSAENGAGGLEIKTTEILRAGQWEEWKNRVPQNYYVQVLHQLLAAEHWNYNILKAKIKWVDDYGNKTATIRHYPFVRVELEEDLNHLLQAEIAFWKCVEEDRKPGLLLPEI